MREQQFTASEQQGEPGHCVLAQVFGPDGKSVATFDATDDPNIASGLAALTALALSDAFPPTP